MGRLSSTAREQLASSGVSSCPSSAPFPSLQNRLRCVENGAKFSKKIRKNAAEKAVADDPGSSSFLLQSEGGVRQQVSKSDRSLQTRQEVRSDGTTHGESVVSCSSSSCSSPSRLLSSYPPETHAPPQHAPRVPSEADECRGRRGTRRTVASAKALRRCRVPSFRKVVTTKSKVSSTGGKRESPRKKKKTPATEKRKKDTMTSSSSSSSSSSSFSAPSGSFSRSFSSSKRKASSSISLGKEKKKNVMSAPSPPISSTCEEASDEDVRRNAVSLKTWFQQNRVDLDTLCSELAEQLPSIPPAAFSEKLQEPLSSLKELLSSWTRILTSGEEYQRDFLDRYDNYVFDIDGVLLMGKQPLTGISEALQKLRSGKKKKRLFFVTNSASKSRRICVEALRDAGIEAYVHEIITSSYATARYLRETFPEVKKVFMIGEEGLKEELNLAGIDVITSETHCLPEDAHSTKEVCSPSSSATLRDITNTAAPSSSSSLPSPSSPRASAGGAVGGGGAISVGGEADFRNISKCLDLSVGAVVVGWDRRLSYTKLCIASLYLQRQKKSEQKGEREVSSRSQPPPPGASRSSPSSPFCRRSPVDGSEAEDSPFSSLPFIAANRDLFDVVGALKMPANGAAVDYLEACSARKAVCVGKPSEWLANWLINRHLSAEHVDCHSDDDAPDRGHRRHPHSLLDAESLPDDADENEWGVSPESHQKDNKKKKVRESTVVVGDRLDTDIQLGKVMKVDTCLVLTGCTTFGVFIKELLRSHEGEASTNKPPCHPPTLVLPHLGLLN